MKYSESIILVFILLFLVSACKNNEVIGEKVVKTGSTVAFDYAAGFVNGTLFDTSIKDAAVKAGIFDPNRVYQPENVVIGQDPLIPGLLEALTGMKEGETKNVIIPPEKAYGARIENATNVVSKSIFDQPEQLRVGGIIVINTPEGDRIPVFVKDLNQENVTIDQNHPLAGKTVQFAVIVRSIK